MTETVYMCIYKPFPLLSSTVRPNCRTVALRRNFCWQTSLSTKIFPESFRSAAMIRPIPILPSSSLDMKNKETCIHTCTCITKMAGSQLSESLVIVRIMLVQFKCLVISTTVSTYCECSHFLFIEMWKKTVIFFNMKLYAYKYSSQIFFVKGSALYKP